MSKLEENPDKIVPKRVLIAAVVITMIIIAMAQILPISLPLTLLFFWAGCVANMISFHLIVKLTDQMIAKKQTGEKAKTMPTLFIRYGLYVAVLTSAWTIGGPIPAAFAFIAIQLSQIIIKLDHFIG